MVEKNPSVSEQTKLQLAAALKILMLLSTETNTKYSNYKNYWFNL